MSGPFIKYGDGLKTVPFIRNQIYIPIGKVGKKAEYKIDIWWETDPKKKMQGMGIHHLGQKISTRKDSHRVKM